MKGLQPIQPGDGPTYKLPDDWSGQRICLKWTAGIGDSLIAISAAALTLKKKRCHITACCMPHIAPLLKLTEGIDDTITSQELNEPQTRNSFDVVVDFSFSINTTREIRPGDYYELVGKHIGIDIGVGKFKIQKKTRRQFEGSESVFIHAAASNPNRQWDTDKWRELAYSLRAMGYHVVWLGTRGDYSFNDTYITTLSDTTDDLVWQTKQLANHGTYFIGNDSGFAHICGLLGIPGWVLFFTTEPDSVIGKYPFMIGIDCYDELNVTPSRSLRPFCEVGSRCSRHITVNRVLQNCKIPIIETRELDRHEVESVKIKIGLYGNDINADLLANFLAQSCEVELLQEFPETNENFDVFVIVKNEIVKITTPTGVEASVKAYRPEVVKRAIREILGRG